MWVCGEDLAWCHIWPRTHSLSRAQLGPELTTVPPTLLELLLCARPTLDKALPLTTVGQTETPLAIQGAQGYS